MRGLSYFFLSILIHMSSGTVTVIGLIGHNVSLPCGYDTQTHGILSFCWGQGKVPRSKCSNTILSSQGGDVLFRQSSRYQLLGRVTDGELSLTIMNAQRSDAGVYGCRVELPGWFNDHKVNTQLIMEEAPVGQTDTEICTLSAELLTTSTPKNVEVSEPILDMFQSTTTEEKFKGFWRMGNIGRMAAIFCFPIIVIFAFIFWRVFLSRGTRQHLNTSAAENIYESVPMI
ncbi:hepatitis A virus cellular receptor 1 homolog [Embiotoca jacksoni]|uniref:hepatitis A virus cellular receptor 1 homolog n=1 Tax=Embiotoca jacksoni TaxID=100190 RepID=UPI003703792A